MKLQEIVSLMGIYKFVDKKTGLVMSVNKQLAEELH